MLIWVEPMDRDQEKVVIVGPGAMGCLFAGLLASRERELWLLDHDPERARGLAERGLIVQRATGRAAIPVRATSDAGEIGEARLVIVCVKAYDTEAAAVAARPLVGKTTDVLSLQNGLGNAEVLNRVFGPERVLAGTTAQGANLVAAGHVIHAGAGETVLGEPGGGLARAEKIAALFNAANIKTTTTGDLTGLVWSKLVINAAINPLTALLGVRNGVLPRLDPAREIMASVVAEIAAVCARRGIRLLHPDPLAKAYAVAEATGENISSMLADVRRKRRTEVGQINGAAAGEAEAVGLAAPVNLALARLVAAVEASYQWKV